MCTCLYAINFCICTTRVGLWGRGRAAPGEEVVTGSKFKYRMPEASRVMIINALAPVFIITAP